MVAGLRFEKGSPNHNFISWIKGENLEHLCTGIMKSVYIQWRSLEFMVHAVSFIVIVIEVVTFMGWIQHVAA